VILCGIGSLRLQERNGANEARAAFAEAKQAAEAVGHNASALQASIALGIALSQLGDQVAGLALVEAAKKKAREQGYKGIEAQALFAEGRLLSAVEPMRPLAKAISSLEGAIEIAARLEMKPLLRAASALLDGVSERSESKPERVKTGQVSASRKT
jgi:hypothetical protein